MLSSRMMITIFICDVAVWTFGSSFTDLDVWA